MVCYFIMMLIPVAFSSMLHSSTSRALTARAYENGHNAVQQIANVNDEKLRTIASVSNTICISSEICKLRYIQLPFNAEKYYEVHQRARYLSTFGAYNNLVSGLYVYCRDLDCILDMYHIYTRSNQYSQIIQREFGLDEATFEALMDQRQAQKLYVTGNGQKFLMMQTVSTGMSDQNPPLTLILVLNNNHITTPLTLVAQTWQGRVSMVMPSDSVLTSLDENESLMTEDTFRDLQEQEELIITRVSSRATDLEYVMAVPQGVLMADVRSNDLLFAYFLAGTILLGGCMAYLLAGHNYKPVRELRQSADVDPRTQNEFTAIASRLKEIKTHNDQMQVELQRLTPIENQQMFRSLLNGKTYRLQEEQLNQLRAGFEGNMFISALLEVDWDAPCPVKEAELKQTLEQKMARLCGSACQCLLQTVENGLAAVFCFNSGSSLYDAQLYVKQLCKSILQEEEGMPALSVYIGNAHEGLEGISVSYKEAGKARDYVNFVSESGKQVFLYDQTMYSSSISWKEYDIVDAQRRFASLMIEGNYAASEQLLREMFSYYIGQEGLSLYVMQCRMYGMMNMMLNILHEVEPDTGAVFYKQNKPLEKLLSVRTMQELEDVVFQIMDQLHSQHDQTQDQLGSKLERVEHYIVANYFDPNLSVQMVADKFDLSLPYLSREFKSKKGIGVLSFINQCRIEKAKELILSNEGGTLTDIAGSVGYNSSQTLIRIFKRYEGVTPGQFRQESEKSTM